MDLFQYLSYEMIRVEIYCVVALRYAIGICSIPLLCLSGDMKGAPEQCQAVSGGLLINVYKFLNSVTPSTSGKPPPLLLP